MRQARAMRAGSLAAVAVLAGGLLWAFGPGLTDLPTRPGLTLQWLRDDPERALLTATALAAWVLLAWLVLGLVVCALTALPGAAGSVAERLSRHVVPSTVRRATGLAVGASLATAPVLSAGTAFAAPAVPPPVVAAQQPAPAAQARGPEGGWPDLGRHPSTAPGPGSTGPGSAGSTPTPAGSADTPTPAPAGTPAPAPPNTPTPAQAWPRTPPATAGPGTAAPAPAGAPGPADPSPAPSPAQDGVYRVRHGDCLWTIAARALGPGAGPAAIESAWHRWYQANRDVVGADPNLLLPGQRLTPPAG